MVYCTRSTVIFTLIYLSFFLLFSLFFSLSCVYVPLICVFQMRKHLTFITIGAMRGIKFINHIESHVCNHKMSWVQPNSCGMNVLYEYIYMNYVATKRRTQPSANINKFLSTGIFVISHVSIDQFFFHFPFELLVLFDED